MSAIVSLFPTHRVTRATRRNHAADVIQLSAVSHGLTQRDLNAIGVLVAKAHGQWRCEVEEGDGGTWALIVPNSCTHREPHGFMVSRDGKRLLLLDAGPTLDWPTRGIFASLEALLDALSPAMGSFAAA